MENWARAHVSLVTLDPLTVRPLPPSPTPKQAGSPNGNWRVTGFVPGSTQWTAARIYVIDNATQAVLLQQNYLCSGTGPSLVCVAS